MLPGVAWCRSLYQGHSRTSWLCARP
jgi:hypothetical protein